MKLLSSDSDVNILYMYACLGAKCATFGLTLSASRSHIVVRDVNGDIIVMDRCIEDAEKLLQKQIDDGAYEHSRQF